MKKYAIISPSSLGVRITPFNRQPVHTSNMYYMQATSAETNVLTVPAALGMPVKVLTKFVESSPIAAFIKKDLQSRGIDFEGKEVPQGDAWGFRHQFNIADSGFGMRGPRVWNDRAGEVGRALDIRDFDIDRIFGAEGTEFLHLSGLICALSSETSLICLELARAAKRYGTKITFDLNYRASFWKGREQELSAIFSEIAALSDVLIGNEEDFQLALGLHGPEAGGKEISGGIEKFQDMIACASERYGNVRVFATTLRQVVSANEHLWGAIMLADGKWYTELPREIQVYDRIGGGDGFVGGLLYAMAKDWPAEKWLRFGWATGALAATMMQDYAMPIDEDQVWSIYAGNARVKR